MTSKHETFSGFLHTALEGTRLRLGSEGLQARTKADTLALRIDVGAVQGIIPEMDLDPWQFADGASLRSGTIGQVGGTEQETGSLTFERQGRGLALTPDFRAIGADTYELLLFREGKVVWRQPGNSGVAGAFNSFTAGRRRACCRVLLYSVGFGRVAPFTLVNGPQIDADNVFFVPERVQNQVSQLNALTLTGRGIEALTLTSTSVAVLDPFVTYRGEGEAHLNASAGDVGVELSEGRSGGAVVVCEGVDRCQLNLAAHQGSAPRLVKLAASTGTEVFRTELALGGGRGRKLEWSAVSGKEAQIRLDLPGDSKIVLKDERIVSTEGAPGTMAAVQAALRAGN